MKIIHVALSLFVSMVLNAGMRYSSSEHLEREPVLLMGLAESGLAANVYDAIIHFNNRPAAQRNGLLNAVRVVIQANPQAGALRDAAIDAAVAAHGGRDMQASAVIKAAVDAAYP